MSILPEYLLINSKNKLKKPITDAKIKKNTDYSL